MYWTAASIALFCAAELIGLRISSRFPEPGRRCLNSGLSPYGFDVMCSNCCAICNERAAIIKVSSCDFLNTYPTKVTVLSWKRIGVLVK